MKESMKIACLAWGSLVWSSGELKIQPEDWREDGPYLPVEFTRRSNNGRMTLIIDEEVEPVQVLWSFLEVDDLRSAIELLAEREKTNKKNIHSITKNEATETDIEGIVQEWARKRNLDAAVWTGLEYSQSTNYKRPTIEEVLKYLKELEGKERERAKKYIEKAPKQINTFYRRKIENELGWVVREK